MSIPGRSAPDRSIWTTATPSPTSTEIFCGRHSPASQIKTRCVLHFHPREGSYTPVVEVDRSCDLRLDVIAWRSQTLEQRYPAQDFLRCEEARAARRDSRCSADSDLRVEGHPAATEEPFAEEQLASLGLQGLPIAGAAGNTRPSLNLANQHTKSIPRTTRFVQRNCVQPSCASH